MIAAGVCRRAKELSITARDPDAVPVRAEGPPSRLRVHSAPAVLRWHPRDPPERALLETVRAHPRYIWWTSTFLTALDLNCEDEEPGLDLFHDHS